MSDEKRLQHTHEELRKAVLKIHHRALKATEGDAYMSVPADPKRDADLMVMNALDELEELRQTVKDRSDDLSKYITATGEWQKRAEKAEALLAELRKDADGNDLQVPIDDDPRFVTPEDVNNWYALRRWVKFCKAHLPEGVIFDTGFRCVSEGGQIFHFDPEIVVSMLDELEELRSLVYGQGTTLPKAGVLHLNGHHITANDPECVLCRVIAQREKLRDRVDDLQEKITQMEKDAAQEAADEKQWNDRLREEQEALAKGSNEWMRKILGESYSSLWGPNLEAFGRGVDELRGKIAKLEAELETERMRLAACGVVALANTPESSVKAREMHPDYRSASLSDVEKMVDEQIRLRTQVAEFDARLESAKKRQRKACVDAVVSQGTTVAEGYAQLVQDTPIVKE